MEVCPKCKKPVEAKDHMTLFNSRPISQITCECGYYGLNIEVEPKDSKRD
jgi:Zn ribbon nucleic-acid-binding protein